MTWQPPAHFSLLQPCNVPDPRAIFPFGAIGAGYSAEFPHRGMDFPAPNGAPGYEPCSGRFVPFTNGGDFGPHAFCIQWFDWLAGEYADIYVLCAHNSATGEPVFPGGRAVCGRQSYYVGALGRTDGGAHVHLQVSNTPRFPVDNVSSVDPAPFLVRGNPVDILQRISQLETKTARAERLICGNGYGRVPGIPITDPDSIALRGDDALAAADADGASLFLGLGDTQAAVDKLRFPPR